MCIKVADLKICEMFRLKSSPSDITMKIYYSFSCKCASKLYEGKPETPEEVLEALKNGDLTSWDPDGKGGFCLDHHVEWPNGNMCGWSFFPPYINQDCEGQQSGEMWINVPHPKDAVTDAIISCMFEKSIGQDDEDALKLVMCMQKELKASGISVGELADQVSEFLGKVVPFEETLGGYQLATPTAILFGMFKCVP